MANEIILPISLTTDGDAAPGELFDLTQALRREVLEQPVLSVSRPERAAEEGAKGLGAEETQLLVTLGTQVVPAIILLLSNWLLRQKDQRLHIKVGDAEVDIPRGMKPEEVERMIKSVTRSAKQVE